MGCLWKDSNTIMVTPVQIVMGMQMYDWVELSCLNWKLNWNIRPPFLLNCHRGEKLCIETFYPIFGPAKNANVEEKKICLQLKTTNLSIFPMVNFKRFILARHKYVDSTLCFDVFKPHNFLRNSDVTYDFKRNVYDKLSMEVIERFDILPHRIPLPCAK